MILPSGVVRAIHIDKSWIINSIGHPMIVTENHDGVLLTAAYNMVKINGPSELKIDYFGTGHHRTVHLVTTAELEVE